jgi:hypothetical protein
VYLNYGATPVIDRHGHHLQQRLPRQLSEPTITAQ